MSEPLGPAVMRTPCTAPKPLRAALAPLDAGAHPIGVALSGGGFRATLVGVGVLRQLASSGQLRNVRHVSSVSGGSIANGLLAHSWAKLRDHDFALETFDAEITEPAMRLTCDTSLSRELVRSAWRTLLPGKNRTHLLGDKLDDHLFGGTRLEDLPDGCWFEINAANLTVGARFRFSRDLVGDYITGSVAATGSQIALADAVAMSCAVPGIFSSVELKKPALPCSKKAGKPELVDGGVYDNLGADALKVRKEMPGLFCIVVNAGGLFDPTPKLSSVPIAGPLYRSNAVLYQQVSSVRSRMLFDEFTSDDPNTLDGVLFSLRTSMPPDSKLSHAQQTALAAFRSEFPEESAEGKAELAGYKTTFDQLPRSVADRLVARGSWLTGATIAAHRH